MRTEIAAIVHEVTGAYAKSYLSNNPAPSPSYAQLGRRATATRPQKDWQQFFRELDFQWQGLKDSVKEKWNAVGRRRKKIGYWVYMKYNLTYCKPPLITIQDPDFILPPLPPL
jgi:hypothetical protein